MFGYVKKALLEAETEKNLVLSQKLRKEEELTKQLQGKLTESERRYSELTSSEEYKLLDDYQSLLIQLTELRNLVEEEARKVNEYRVSELEKSKSEIDEQIQRIRLEATKEIDKIERNLTEKSKLVLEIDENIKNKNKELKKLESRIEVQDELNTIRPVTQEITGINSEEIKVRIDENKNKQKSAVKSGKAWKAYEHFYWNDNFTAGKAKQRRLAKFLLAAFNSETDNQIGLAKKNNFHKCHRNIEKWFEAINKLGEDWSVAIERNYLKLRLEELRIVVEHHLQIEFEKEEERYINESIREEKRVQREIENFVKAREKEEKDYKEEIDKATQALKASSEAEVAKLKTQIENLQFKLERTIKEKERAMSLAQLTRSGHVYIISNEGSFGQGVYKIGMTRRLDPMDRVKELGDASVPFFFDVHGIIHSDDAPSLERDLHKRFESYRVNKENYRREFFKVSIDEIENAICEIHGQISLDRLACNEEPEDGEFQDED